MGFLPSNATGVTEVSSSSAQMPSKTYRMHIDAERVMGSADGIDAVAQAAYKILNTERYRFVIYSWDYGVELQNLFGKPLPYVYSERPRRIREALIQDDRIREVDGFELSHNRGDVMAKFTIHTDFGDLELEKGVTIA